MSGSRVDDIEVLYVMGTSRSGSTILDISLGCHPDLASFGELNNFIHQGWIRREYCSCGVPGPECEFWRSISEEWLSDSEISTPEEYYRLQRRLESFVGLGTIIRPGRRSSSPFDVYASSTRRLFGVLRERSGRPVIIDSSKNPVRAIMLSRIPGIDLKVIHIVRDPRGVAWSQRKRFKRDLASGLPKNTRGQPAWYTTANWLSVNAFAETIRKINLGMTSMLLRYEDFLENLHGALERIGSLLGRDLGSLADMLEGDIDIDSRHQIAGNRVRMSNKVRLKLDEGWKTGFSAADLRLTELIARPLMVRYGYQPYRHSRVM